MKTKIKNLLFAVIVCCGISAVLTACSKDNTSDMSLSGSCLVEELELNGQYKAFIDIEKRLLKVKVPIDFTQTDDMTITTKGGQKTITITPVGKKRQLFTSFVLTLDTKTSAIVHLRMNARGEDYINYDFK